LEEILSKITSTEINAPYFEKRKKIWIYLPNNYDAGENFPVVYMNDGQDLFYDNLAKRRVSWRVAETMDELYHRENISAIIVGIESDDRQKEFLPWNTAKKKPFFKADDSINYGQEYADFLAKILKPYIDKNYKTDERACNTAIAGADLGALSAVYTGLKYNYIFGNICSFSLKADACKNKLEKFVSEIECEKTPSFYIYCGGAESQSNAENKEFLKNSAFLSQTIFKRNAKIRQTLDSTGLNHESRWGEEFYGFMRYFASLLQK